MDCKAYVSRKSTHFTIFLTATLFASLLASTPGFSEESVTSPDPISKNSVPPTRFNGNRPFSKIAVGVTAGTFGVGVEAVTPLSRRTNLRVDGNFFNYSQTFSEDGVSYNANLKLRDVRASYDFYPFHGGFRLSAGLAMYNQFNVGAVATVPAGQTITLNDTDFYSSTSDPLHGSATVAYDHKVAPTLTFGWGNAIPRSGRHLAFPVEIGAAFTGAPKFNLTMAGSACADQNDPATCQTAASYPDFQTHLTEERNKINNDMEPFRVYPIINAGVTYRF